MIQSLLQFYDYALFCLHEIKCCNAELQYILLNRNTYNESFIYSMLITKIFALIVYE